MPEPTEKKRSLRFYVDLLLAADILLIAVIVVGGGINLEAGGLGLRVESLHYPALLLLALFVARKVVSAWEGEEGTPWQESFFGPAGSSTERWRCVEALFLMVAFYTFVVGSASIGRLRDFGSSAASIGSASQTAWNIVHGRFFHSSLVDNGSWLGAHFSPVMAVIGQGYRFWPTPAYFLNLQTFFLALGAWPVYVIARRNLEDRRWALGLAALYLVHPALRGVNLAGFDPVTLAVTPLLFAFYLLEDKGRWSGYFFVLFALACGEGAWLASSCLGLYLCFVRRRWREGLFLFLLTFYGFVLVVTYVMPGMRGVETADFSRFSHLGGSTEEILGRIFLHPVETALLLADPERLRHLKDLLLPLAYLPLLGPLQFAAGLPVLLGNLLGNDPAFYSIRTPHAALVLPFLFGAAAAGLRRARDGWMLKRLKLLDGWLLPWALIILPLLVFGVPPAASTRAELPDGFRESFNETAAMIPAGASLATEDRLAPYFADRESLSLFPDVGEAEFVLIDAGRAGEAIDGREDGGGVLAGLLREGGYGLHSRDEFFLLLSRPQKE
jgi:uncharacterized membrane protein